MQAKDIINKLIWIDAKVYSMENIGYQNYLRNTYGLRIETYDNSYNGIEALSKIQFESIFVITSGTIYPEFYGYMKRNFKELRVIPFSIIFTSSSRDFVIKHQNDEIGKIYYKTFFNRGGVVDTFKDVVAFINDIYLKLNSYQTHNIFDGIFTKDYTGFIVFETFKDNLSLPTFFNDIYINRNLNYSELHNFTLFFLNNYCNNADLIKLLKPILLFQEVPEEIISKYWARIYTYETPFYSIMNKNLMARIYNQYEIYIKLLYKGLACNSYRPKFGATLCRGTKLELSEINYLKSIAGTNQIIINKSFLSFSLNKKKSIEFQCNTYRCPINMGYTNYLPLKEDQSLLSNPNKTNSPFKNAVPIINPHFGNSQCVSQLIPQCIPPSLPIKIQKVSLSVLIEIENIKECEKNHYMISNAYLYDISCYTKEEEVLVFPFTGFEVISWEKVNLIDENNNEVEGTSFKFRFSKEYCQRIKAKYGSFFR